MKVKNDFPNVDKVLRKLKELNEYVTKTIEENNENSIAKYALEYIKGFVISIERYLDSVCNADMRIAKVRESTRDSQVIRDAIQEEDKLRSDYHSEIIVNMVMIDRCAEKLGLSRVFDYAEEFQNQYTLLTAHTVEEKARMTERQRIKRREMGNFGLYIAAAVTAGVSREAAEITDDDLREFANCDGDKVSVNTDIFRRVKENSHSLKRNMDIIIGDR